VLSQELQDLVQAKIGTTSFAAAYNQIRQGALSIRRERKVARAMLVSETHILPAELLMSVIGDYESRGSGQEADTAQYFQKGKPKTKGSCYRVGTS
jgi:hypothetical protein